MTTVSYSTYLEFEISNYQKPHVIFDALHLVTNPQLHNYIIATAAANAPSPAIKAPPLFNSPAPPVLLGSPVLVALELELPVLVPLPEVVVAFVTLNEFPANTVSPAAFTTFTAEKFCLVCANDARVDTIELLPVVLSSICVYRWDRGARFGGEGWM